MRVIQWSNDVLSTLFDLYEEKYLAFAMGLFKSRIGKTFGKAYDTYSCKKCKDNNSMS